MSSDTEAHQPWWKEAVVYQIYPKSFNDTDGDGIGDLEGIERKVEYLADLGVDAVWLNPVYESPQADNGYDISDYRSIMDAYGDTDDWRRLLEKFHARDIRLIMDLVVNHTSDEHEWFRKSRQQDGPYEDYYYWVDDSPDDPPNNWESIFGGPAWTYDEERGAWYLHLFDEKQPDLNWDNPAVREDIFEMMRWWLDQGIDGFRMDVINLISKTSGLPDGDPDGGLTGAEHFFNGPNVHEYVSEMVNEAIPNRDVLTVGETPGASIEDAQEFVGPDGDGLSMVFQFEHVGVDHDGNKWEAGDWSLVEFKEIIAKWQNGLADDGWNSIYLNNHDQPRMVSRFGDDEYRRESAKLLGTLTHTLQGTPFIYQGEEIGMTNTPFESRDELRDVEAINFVEDAIESGEATCYEDVRDAIEYISRDNARTPMQWSEADDNAGFTEGDPWLKVNPNYTDINVAAARANPDSVWHYYRDIIELRSERDLLVYGDFELLRPDDQSVFAYERTLDGDRGLVVLNVDDEPSVFDVPTDISVENLELAMANDDVPERPSRTMELTPYEARVYLTP